MLVAAVLGTLSLTALIVAAASWGVAGQPVDLGTRHRLSSERFQVETVTARGAQAGLRVGDLYDTRLMSVPERIMWWNNEARAGTTIDVPVLRGGRIVLAHQPFERLQVPATERAARWAVLVTLFLAALVGIFIIARGKGKASLAAGIMLVAFSTTLSTISDAIAPVWLIILVHLVHAFSIVAFPAAAFVMAQYLLPESSRPVRTVLWILFGVATLFSAASYLVDYPIFLFTGRSVFNFSLYWEWPVIASLVLTLITLGLAAAQAHEKDGAAVRILFAATVVGFVPQIMLLAFLFATLDGKPPGWWSYVVLITWTLLLAGYLYAVFASRVYDVDFFISRSIVYGVVIAIVVGILALAESLIERAALGNVENTVLSLAAPVLLGLSARWIGQRVEDTVERTFYRKKIIAHDRLRALADDFAEAHEAEGLAGRVTREIHKQFNAPAAVYRFANDGYEPCAADGIDLARLPFIAQDDPVFMRLRRSRSPVDTHHFDTALPFAGLAFPLIVLGRVYGAILAGSRPHDQWYDPDDQEVIASLAHELGIALLWLRSDDLPVPQPF